MKELNLEIRKAKAVKMFNDINLNKKNKIPAGLDRDVTVVSGL